MSAVIIIFSTRGNRWSSYTIIEVLLDDKIRARHILLGFYEFDHFIYFTKWNLSIFLCGWLISFNLMPSSITQVLVYDRISFFKAE